MSTPFPSLQLFEALKKRVESDPAGMAGVPPCDAYCGFAIGDTLIVLEFDGQACAAVANGGNTLDLDFFLSAPPEVWRETFDNIHSTGGADENHTLEALIESGRVALRSENEGGEDTGRAALEFLQAFLDQSKALDLEARP
jgi:hypothetical protein